jgi:hypothetical protein
VPNRIELSADYSIEGTEIGVLHIKIVEVELLMSKSTFGQLYTERKRRIIVQSYLTS